MSEALGNATSKLKMYSNQEQESVLSRHLAGFEVINRRGDPSIQPVLAELEQAVANEFSVEIDYHTRRDDQPKTRVIDPYGMVYWNNKWYIVAFCHLRNEIRSFRVERILQIKRTQNIFKRSGSFWLGNFFAKSIT